MVCQVLNVPHSGDMGLTPAETLSHFGLWCMMASPLWITYDIFKPPPGVHEIVTNTDAIRINQDPLGRPAVRIDGAVRNPVGILAVFGGWMFALTSTLQKRGCAEAGAALAQ